MTYEPVTVLRVLAWGRQVGAAVMSSKPPFTMFQFDPVWLANGPQLAPLLMPHRDADRVYTFRDLDLATFRGLPPLLADSLPDSFGNVLTEAYLADVGVLPHELTGLDRLAYLGSRGLGALTFEPDYAAELGRPTALDLAGLVQAARAVVTGDLRDSPGRREAVRQLQGIGTSAGGAQAKAVVAWNRASGEIRAQTGGDPSFEPWLLKFDVSPEPSVQGRIEYAYHHMAQSAGIQLPAATLLAESGRAHFMVRRFDRDLAGNRLHQQSFCALAGLDFTRLATHSAVSLFQVADALGLGSDTRQELLRRIAFNVLAGNRDDHPKNYAFLMDSAGDWALSPAFDLTFAWDSGNPWLAQHHLAVEGKFTGITRDSVMTLADRCAVPDAENIVSMVEDAVAGWRDHAQAADVPAEAAGLVATALATLRQDWR